MLLDDAMARRALGAARDIGEALRECAVESPSLESGSAGLALTFAALDRAFPGGGYGEDVERHLAAAVDAGGPSLYHGVTGAAWVTELLAVEDADPDRQVDAWLAGALASVDFDLVGGLVGIGVYALERGERGARLVAEVVSRLAERAEPVRHGLTWRTPATGWINLGLAHGVPCVIAFLARAVRAGERRALALLDGAVSYLRAQELEAGGYPPREGRAERAGLGWCYGDPGVAAALWQAGVAAGEPAWRDAALELARRAASRSAESFDRMDASLCHGVAGTARIYHRLWQVSGDVELEAMARRSIARLLDLARPGAGIGGYQFATVDGWKTHAGLLAGSAGVALALLAAASDEDPMWDRAMLLPGGHTDLPVRA